MKKISLVAACLLAVGLIASPAMAASIAITNHDFEDTPVTGAGGASGAVSAEPGANPYSDPSSWTMSPVQTNGNRWTIFQFNPDDVGVNGYFGTTDASAPNFGVAANMDGTTLLSLGSGTSIAQVTGTAFTVGKEYTLTVAIGFKNPAGTIGDYVLDITNGSGVSLATATATPTHDTKLYNYSVVYTATGAAGETGNIGVKIGATGANAIAIDNVRLTCVPEPSSFALAGLSLVGLIGSVRRRRNRA